MHKLLSIAFTILICLGCDYDQVSGIDIPDDVELDLDQDGDTDFIIAYLQRIEGDPIGNYQAVRMNLESSDFNQVLKNENQFPIFLDETSIIETEVESPYYWETTNPSSNISTPIATIRTEYDEITWNDEWMVFSMEQKESYLIGFKLLDDNDSQIGFIEFSVDPQTGKLNLMKTEFL